MAPSPLSEAEDAELKLLPDGKGKRGTRDLADPIAAEWSDGPLDEAAATPQPIPILSRRPAIRKPASNSAHKKLVLA
jgi:hypothetical protein